MWGIEADSGCSSCRQTRHMAFKGLQERGRSIRVLPNKGHCRVVMEKFGRHPKRCSISSPLGLVIPPGGALGPHPANLWQDQILALHSLDAPKRTHLRGPVADVAARNHKPRCRFEQWWWWWWWWFGQLNPTADGAKSILFRNGHARGRQKIIIVQAAVVQRTLRNTPLLSAFFFLLPL